MKSGDKIKYSNLFVLTQTQEHLLTKVILTMCLNQFTLRLYQTCKNLLEKVQVWLLIHS